MEKKGFTLIEILIVLVIIGILIAVILPNALSSIQQANARNCAATLRNIDAAIQVCYNKTNDWTKCGPGGIQNDLVTPGYLEAFPLQDSYQVAYALIQSTNGDQGWTSDKTTHFRAWPDVTTYY